MKCDAKGCNSSSVPPGGDGWYCGLASAGYTIANVKDITLLRRQRELLLGSREHVGVFLTRDAQIDHFCCLECALAHSKAKMLIAAPTPVPRSPDVPAEGSQG